MGNESNNGKVPLISKVAYGFGDVGCNFSWMFVSNFLMIFYTDVFGILFFLNINNYFHGCLAVVINILICSQIILKCKCFGN